MEKSNESINLKSVDIVVYAV